MTANFDFIAYKGKKKQPVQVPIPDLQGAPLVETHAHLDMLEDPSLALARAAHAGITTVLTLTDMSAGAELSYEMQGVWQEGAQILLDVYAEQTGSSTAIQVPATYIMAGVHPHNARHFNKQIEKQLIRLAADKRTVALGEAGLDYYYDHSPRETQRAVFTRKLELAHELDLPVIVHLRDAHDDGLRILQEVGTPAAGAVLHCYNRDIETAKPFLELGCTLGFGGPVTFKSAHEVKEAATLVPANAVVVETDCPFMAPTPFRGQKCEPAHTLWVAEEIANLRNTDLPDFAKQTTANATKIFRLPS